MHKVDYLAFFPSNHVSLVNKNNGERRQVVLDPSMNGPDKISIVAFEKCQGGKTVMPYAMTYPKHTWEIKR